MPKFNYIAMDGSGRETKGSVEAATQAQAIAQIRSQGLFPTAIGLAGGGGGKAAAKGAAGGAKASSGKGMSMEIKLPAFLQPRVKAKELTLFTRQLATLVDAGLPLLRGLRVLQRQTNNTTLKNALQSMSESVESGSTFSEALALHPRIFDNLFINMVRAGEAGGVLELVLTRLSEFMEKSEKIKNKVKSAMTYPIVVLVAAIGITAFLLLTVIPKFEEIFLDLLEGKSLPGVTRFVIATSNVLKNYFLVVVGVIAAIVILMKLWTSTKSGRIIMDHIKTRTPIFGTLIRRTAIARFTRTLGTLMASGVPVLQALTIVGDTSGNAVYASALQRVHDSVKEGETMAGPMEQTKAFPPMVISMVEVGEETGALPDMLARIADTYEDEVDNAVAALTSILEPIMIIFLAVIVGTIVIAMFLPLVSIITTLGGAGG
ncbi:MAG: type II secretion system F family protein [Lentisphaerae bacterium]|jgi:type IV pilus assembly protein PilC|nr:type II secretion system F family protein [Lentisphaerota bacterium]